LNFLVWEIGAIVAVRLRSRSPKPDEKSAASFRKPYDPSEVFVGKFLGFPAERLSFGLELSFNQMRKKSSFR
jgi:hypothetical protein